LGVGVGVGVGGGCVVCGSEYGGTVATLRIVQVSNGGSGGGGVGDSEIVPGVRENRGVGRSESWGGKGEMLLGFMRVGKGQE